MFSAQPNGQVFGKLSEIWLAARRKRSILRKDLAKERNL